MATRALIHMPRSARRGEVIEVRALIAHPMETGFRSDSDGRTLPRNILRRFECRNGSELVFAAELHPAIAANPYLSFFVTVQEPGEFSFAWMGDQGFVHREGVSLALT